MRVLSGLTSLAVVSSLVAVHAQDTRARLDDVQRLASQRNYAAAISTFEAIRAQQPNEITALDGLKMVTVYAETGDTQKFEALTRWMVDRWKTPRTATDAERSVKGYIISKLATDKALLEHAVVVTRYASDNAARDGEGQYQGFFDTSHGVALYRAGRHAEAAQWLAKTLTHTSLYVRTLALPFYAMTERALGNGQRATEVMAQARLEAAKLPAPGSEQYGVEWTDTLISRMVMAEADALFR
jgi:tetratricopeptide (TPR) repeat protein